MNPTEQFNQLESAKQSLLKMSEGLKTGALVPKTVPPPTTTTVDASKLGTQSVAFPPTPTPTPVAMPTPSIDEQAKSFAEASQQTAPTAAETAMTETQSRFKQLSEKLFGKSAAQRAAEQAQGIPQKSQAVADIQAQINQLQNEATAQKIALEGQGRGITQGVLSAQEGGIERARTIKALQLNSFLYAAQGSLAVAQDMADRAVKAEFEPIEQELAFQKEWIDMNKDNLSREDKKRAEKLELQLQERTRLLNEEKANKTAIQNIGLEAAKNGADAVTLRNIQNAKTPEDAITASGAFLSTPQTDVIKLDNGNTVIVDKRTNQIVKNLGGAKPIVGTSIGGDMTGEFVGGEATQARAQSNVSEIDALKTAKGLNKAVGPTFLGRWTPFKADVMTGDKASFIAGVEQLASNLSLDSLVQAKSRGATFGALSDSEMKILSASASKIGTWRKLDKDGNVVGYSASEKAFKSELDKISNFSKLDYILKGGDPASVGVQQTPDGKLWAVNSDGTLTQLR